MPSMKSRVAQSRVGKSGSEGQKENMQHMLFTVGLKGFLQCEFSPKRDSQNRDHGLCLVSFAFHSA